MQLVVGKQYKTRSGKIVGVAKELSRERGRDFVNIKDNTMFLVIDDRRLWEKYNSDGSYINPNTPHPKDIVDELSS